MKRNPFKSEGDAFRLLVLIGIAALVVISVAAVAGSVPAALLGLVLVLFGAFHAWRWLRQGLRQPPTEGG